MPSPTETNYIALRLPGASETSAIVDVDKWLDQFSCERDKEFEEKLLKKDPFYEKFLASEETKGLSMPLEAMFKDVISVCLTTGGPQAVEETVYRISNDIKTYLSLIRTKVREEKEFLCKHRIQLANRVDVVSKMIGVAQYEETHFPVLKACKHLKTKYTEMNTIKRNRMEKSRELVAKHEKLCAELGIHQDRSVGQRSIPTEEELGRLAIDVENLEAFVSGKGDENQRLKDSIATYADKLELSKFSYEETDLSKLHKLNSRLELKYKSYKEEFKELRNRMASMNDSYLISRPELNLILENHSYCRPSVIKSLRAHLAELEALKKKRKTGLNNNVHAN